MSSKLFRIQSSYVMQSSSSHVERFFIQKKFLWWWVDLSNDGLGFTNNFSSHSMAIKILNKNKNNLKSKYYLREDDRLISGDSTEEVNKKVKMKAFL